MLIANLPTFETRRRVEGFVAGYIFDENPAFTGLVRQPGGQRRRMSG